jgi:hypothetical protein
VLPVQSPEVVCPPLFVQVIDGGGGLARTFLRLIVGAATTTNPNCWKWSHNCNCHPFDRWLYGCGCVWAIL